MSRPHRHNDRSHRPHGSGRHSSSDETLVGDERTRVRDAERKVDAYIQEARNLRLENAQLDAELRAVKRARDEALRTIDELKGQLLAERTSRLSVNDYPRRSEPADTGYLGTVPRRSASRRPPGVRFQEEPPRATVGSSYRLNRNDGAYHSVPVQITRL